jgi:NhaP-type Na+/H+ or K+/H+ antiporter
VLFSIVVHGVSVTPIMRWLDRRRDARAADRQRQPAEV